MSICNPLRGVLLSIFKRRPILKFGQANSKICDIITSGLRGMHLDRTKGMYRQDVLVNAVVKKICPISPTVKLLQLKVNHADFFFHAGQWLDVIIPQISTIGGFSICSDPISYKEDSTITLAVKSSDHPPAKWIHTTCSVGAELSIRVGGEFYINDKSIPNVKNLILIAGGVGINPILSIANYMAKLNVQDSSMVPDNIIILYSAKEDEFIFKDDIKSLCSSCQKMDAQFFITGRNLSDRLAGSHDGRIKCEDFKSHILSKTINETLCYICGPPTMISDVVVSLKSYGLNDDQIKYEKWW